MTLTLNHLSDNLKSTIRNTDFSNVSAQAEQAVKNFDAKVKTILGSSIGEIRGGIEALTQDIDEAEEVGSISQNPTVTRATTNVPGVGSKMVGSVSNGSDISAITGTPSSASNGFSHDIISAGSPEAIQAALKSSINATTSELTEALKGLTTDDLSSVVGSAINKSPFTNFQKQVDAFVTQLNNNIQSASKFFLVDLGEKLEKNYETNVLSLVDNSMSYGDIETTFIQVSRGEHDKAFSTIQKYIDLPEDYDFVINNLPRSDWNNDIVAANERVAQVESEFKVLSVELSSYASPYDPSNAAAGLNTSSVIGTSGLGARTGRDTSGNNWNFDDITSLEELESMFMNVNRRPGEEINGAIIHWSATFNDQNIGSDWLHRVHIDRGFSGCGYHIIIRRDGTLQRGRPLNRTGAHDLNNNKNFLGFCFVGGVNESSSRAQKPYWRYASADSLTPAQFKAYDGLMRTFHNVFPHGQVQGHYATSNDGKVDPGFDVPGYSLSKFGHHNVIPENDSRWKSQTAITLAAIRSAGATS